MQNAEQAQGIIRLNKRTAKRESSGEFKDMKIGFIGLGIMGKPMCLNLVRAGYEVTVYTHKEAVMDELVLAGAMKASGTAELARSCEVILTMLPDSPQVREVVLGDGGILENAVPGTLLIDLSSIDPAQTKAIGEALGKKGIRMVDAPVSGGEAKAISGTLAIMAGGAPEDFKRSLPILEVMGGSITYMGDLGSGNVTKLANQIIIALNIAAVAEAMVFAQKSGVDPHRVYEAIRSGSAGSAVLDTKLNKMIRHDFKPGFRLELHHKDLKNALTAAQAVDVQLPQTRQILAVIQKLESEGYSMEDHTAILRYFEELSQFELSSEQN